MDFRKPARLEPLDTPEGRYKFLKTVILTGYVVVGLLTVGVLIIEEAPFWIPLIPIVPIIWLEFLKHKEFKQITDLKKLARLEPLDTPEGRYKFLRRVILMGYVGVGLLTVAALIAEEAPFWTPLIPIVPIIWLEFLKHKQFKQIVE